ncbi:hypothetical protein N7539_000420 [Penicillium diatomitis]|uniref:CASTOR ACT domain-containing protein n=1 Tax=Penicillium diatomitis TaxID=2819901 RepID=A0A9W9XN44_9EURO|nr:uncharacterized protein N7539_000420 [Penicillium diatomitis]KAJ5495304.1 hypothetical protein N7539_000420 [Penicillium diatomitis]
MNPSMNLINAQVHFLEDHLVLVHIPLSLYHYFFKTILGILFDETPALDCLQAREDIEENAQDELDSTSDPAWYREPAFLNVSITPVEVSIICPKRLVKRYLDPVLEQLGQINHSLRESVDISNHEYIAMQVLGQGLEAGKRVLELTSPLAMAGISIFFITTYFSDYILVPRRHKASVISALESKGFQFENANDAFVSPLTPTAERKLSDAMSPVTPPPSTVAELQTRTFQNLRARHIFPTVDDSIRLVQCAVHHEYYSRESSLSILREALITTLVVDDPRFLSLTLAALDSSASLLLEKRLLPRFARLSQDGNDKDLLLGAHGDTLVPIMLDLRDLPLEASGIVCGVAGRLAEATSCPPSAINSEDSSEPGSTTQQATSASKVSREISTRLTLGSSVTPSPLSHHLKPDVDPSADAVEISFLSTARAGTIIVGVDELQRAVDALEAEKKSRGLLQVTRQMSPADWDSV